MSMEQTPFEPMSVADRRERHQEFLDQAAACTNVGQTGDNRDLYVIFDDMLAFIKGSLPTFACQEGCHHCCNLSPAVSTVEWQVILAHLPTLPKAVRDIIILQADTLRTMTWIFDKARQQTLTGTDERPIAAFAPCPFLVDQSCSIYAVRPLKCRGYGYSMVNTPDRQKFFGSLIALNWIRQMFPPQIDIAQVILPAFDRYQAVLDRLNEAAEGDSAFLAQWIWAHVEKGDFVSDLRAYTPEAAPGPDAG
jgi:Fe-S-cluster containining protein